jgi:predicted alpha/beta hydrolase family esterase
MKNQKPTIILIHGGTSFGKRDFISPTLYNLLDLSEFGNTQNYAWYLEFKKRSIEQGYNTIYLNMPMAHDARFDEWKLRFEYTLQQLIGQELILIGHSLGACFLASYLQKFEIKLLSQLLLIAPCTKEGDFIVGDNWQNIKNQCSNIKVIHSTDDAVCDYLSQGKFISESLNSKLITFEDKGHMNGEEFETVLNIVNNLDVG